MAKSRTTLITEYLHGLVQETPIIQNCWVAGVGGLLIGAALPWVDGEIINCWGAVVLSHAQRLLEECNLGKVEAIQVAPRDFRITVVPVGDEAVLVITHHIPPATPELTAKTIEKAVSYLEELI